jgi:adenylylsulfate reductase subunit B
MPTYVRTDRCDGCDGLDAAACMHVCPHDLMHLDRDGSVTGHVAKAYNREPGRCWECHACVKACPRGAVGSRPAADIAPLGGDVRPTPGDDAIAWEIAFRNGDGERFEYPVRTLSRGSVDPYGDRPSADLRRIADNGFFAGHGGYRGGDPDELIAK